jgi:hypothetical protein
MKQKEKLGKHDEIEAQIPDDTSYRTVCGSTKLLKPKINNDYPHIHLIHVKNINNYSNLL